MITEHSVPGGFASQVSKIVAERGSTYGTPADNHQLTADLWSAWLSRRLGPVQLSAEDVCALNVLQKLSRLAFITKDDSWLDVAGFTENVALLRPDQRNVADEPKQSATDRIAALLNRPWVTNRTETTQV